MTTIDRRTLLTAMLGAGVAASALGGLASQAAAVPRAAPIKPTGDAPAEVAAGEEEATVHQAQLFVVRRRPRRRWIWRRPIRRRRVIYY